MIIAAVIISLLGGGLAGYFIGDGLAPGGDYTECIITVRSGKGGANIKDCDGFKREKTTKGMLENFKLCYETWKVSDKPKKLNCVKEVLTRFNDKNKKEE